jgi:hypothetical protein
VTCRVTSHTRNKSKQYLFVEKPKSSLQGSQDSETTKNKLRHKYLKTKPVLKSQILSNGKRKQWPPAKLVRKEQINSPLGVRS